MRWSKLKEKLHSVFVLSILIIFSPLILIPMSTEHDTIRESFEMWKEDLKMSLKILGVMK